MGDRVFGSHSLEVLVRDVFVYDLLVRLKLQKLENEAEKFGRLPLAPVRAANTPQFDCLLQQTLWRQGEALLLPVQLLVDSLPHYAFYQIL